MTMLRKVMLGIAAVLGCSAVATAQECNREAAVKSAPGGASSEIEFKNSSGQQRRVYWIDESGQRKLKAVIEPRQTSLMKTYALHAFVVTGPDESCLYIVTASSAPIAVDVGGGSSSESREPVAIGGGSSQSRLDGRTSAIQRFNLSGWYQIKSVSKQGYGLNNLDTGFPEVEKTKSDWDSAYWQFEEVSGTPFVMIKNKWKGTYLQDVRGSLRVASTARSNEAAHWELEEAASGPYGRIKNRRDGRYLVSTRDGFDLVERPDSGSSSAWSLVPSSSGGSGFVAPPVAPRVTKKAEPECSKHETYSEKRERCIKIADTCSKGERYSSSVRACVRIADTCSSDEVYSPSENECVPKKKKKKKCDDGYSLVDGDCKKDKPKIKNPDKPDGPKKCPEGTIKSSKTGQCVYNGKNNKGFEYKPWEKPVCKGLKSSCNSGNKTACKKFEETCQVN